MDAELRDQLKNLSISDLMEQWPEAVPVFVRYRMACPGCIMAPFMTMADAAREYHLDMDLLLEAIAQAIEAEPI